ncbi:MAG: type II toxin-antitoxin system RelE/ParE family toxin [Gammaproteobacteria bacterium]|nr:type II toxin-antitoxin system RelE/ParE family toxin [Gammaproteobacteria bacterium]
MPWTVLFCEEFHSEFRALPEEPQDELLAHALLLQEFGPDLGRPTVNTLKGSRYPNMKELRFSWHGEVWRVAFAFDPRRQAVFLAAGNKKGTHHERFYRKLIETAEKRYEQYLDTLHK